MLNRFLIKGLAALFSVVLMGSVSLASSAVHIQLHGEVTPAMAAFLQRSLADVTPSDTVVLDLDTVGGRVDSVLKMAQDLQHVSANQVVTYIRDKAWSAGALIALASDEIYMAPGATIGSATPVNGQSAKPLDEKYVSAIRAKFRALAQENGHPEWLAVAMVDKDISVYQLKDGGDITFVSNIPSGDTRAAITVIESGKLLNLTANEALKYGLAMGIYTDMPGLFSALKIEDVTVLEPGLIAKLAGITTNSVVSGLLISLGFLLIFAELKTAGGGIAGVLGALCLGLALGGHYLISYAQWFEIGCVFLGVLLILAEIFLIPGFGLAGIMGAVLMLVSLFLAITPAGLPTAPWLVDVWVSAALVIVSSAIAAVIAGIFLVDRFARFFALNTQLANASAPLAGQLEKDNVLHEGETGVTISVLRPVGEARFLGKIYTVRCENGYLGSDKPVQVTRVTRDTVWVSPIPDKES